MEYDPELNHIISELYARDPQYMDQLRASNPAVDARLCGIEAGIIEHLEIYGTLDAVDPDTFVEDDGDEEFEELKKKRTTRNVKRTTRKTTRNLKRTTKRTTRTLKRIAARISAGTSSRTSSSKATSQVGLRASPPYFRIRHDKKSSPSDFRNPFTFPLFQQTARNQVHWCLLLQVTRDLTTGHRTMVEALDKDGFSILVSFNFPDDYEFDRESVDIGTTLAQ
ncbi:hypothetical protein C8J56DRAFT_920542 [Mycena floridula]|nr:hypothetical protein C8J56DRAFT_920542 [Mycena floridula]